MDAFGYTVGISWRSHQRGARTSSRLDSALVSALTRPAYRLASAVWHAAVWHAAVGVDCTELGWGWHGITSRCCTSTSRPPRWTPSGHINAHWPGLSSTTIGNT